MDLLSVSDYKFDHDGPQINYNYKLTTTTTLQTDW
jgi:hypothetical protein